MFELVRTQVGIPICQCLLCRPIEPNRNAALGLCAKYPSVCSASSAGPALCTSPTPSSLFSESLLFVPLEVACPLLTHNPVAYSQSHFSRPGTQACRLDMQPEPAPSGNPLTPPLQVSDLRFAFSSIFSSLTLFCRSLSP